MDNIFCGHHTQNGGPQKSLQKFGSRFGAYDTTGPKCTELASNVQIGFKCTELASNVQNQSQMYCL